MKPFYFLCLFSFFFLLQKNANSQSFSNTTGGNVPDNTLIFFPITVTGLPNSIDSTNFGLKSVCVNITHAYVGQLDLYLKSPTGILVKLSNNRGSDGKNFTNTCFQEDGQLPIEVGVAPFLGSFIPEETINRVNRGINPNGIWYVGIQDEIPYVTGKLNSCTLTFGNNPPATPITTRCTLSNGLACKCPDGSQDCDLLPDMTNSAKVIQTNYYDEPALLHIGVGTPNIGYGPLEILGTSECYCDSVKVTDPLIPCPNGEYPKEKVIQRIYHKSGSVITHYDRAAGYMLFHPSHGHIHMEYWSYNTLRIKGPQQNPSQWPIVGKDAKVSFCLVNNFNCSANLGYCTDALGNPISHTNTGNPGLGIASGCGREQGIFPGYLDIYFPGYDGQELHFDSSMCNGTYYVVSTTDPYNSIVEISKSNNTAVVPIILGFQNANCCTTGFYADTLLGEAPFKVNFIDTTKPSSKKWLWDFGDGVTDTTQFPMHIYTQPGNYTVSLKTVADQTGCTNSVSKSKYIKVRSTPTVNNPNNINVYPNPFSSIINVFYHSNTGSVNSVTVMDVAGRVVYTGEAILEDAGLYEKTIKLTQLPNGPYIIKASVGNTTKYIKVVKQ